MSTDLALLLDSYDSDARSHFSGFNSQDVHDMEEIADNLSDFDFDVLMPVQNLLLTMMMMKITHLHQIQIQKS